MKINKKYYSVIIISLLSISYIASCNDDDLSVNPIPPGEFGLKTSLVVVVNPKVNQWSTTTIVPGTQRDGINIRVGEAVSATTNSNGLAVLTDIPTGSSVPVRFESSTKYINIQQPKELYDYVVSYKNGIVEEMFPIVRYPIGGQVILLDSTQNINNFINLDNTIIVLKPGTFSGDINITARNVLIFGSSSYNGDPLSIIQGKVLVSGEAARLRGLYIRNNLSVNANNFEVAFCKINSAAIQGNNILLLRNVFTVGQASVSSSNSIMLDNIGIP